MAYELMFDGDAANHRPYCLGLVDVQALEVENTEYDSEKSGVKGIKSGQKPNKLGPSQAQVRPKSGGCQAPEIEGNSNQNKSLGVVRNGYTETTQPGQKTPCRSRSEKNRVKGSTR